MRRQQQSKRRPAGRAGANPDNHMRIRATGGCTASTRPLEHSSVADPSAPVGVRCPISATNVLTLSCALWACFSNTAKQKVHCACTQVLHAITACDRSSSELL